MKNNQAKNLCWEMFKKTGKVSYYLFYKNLKEE